MEKIVLGIETSCDDTSLCLLKDVGDDFPVVLSHLSFSQEQLLAKWGGVVPELAARNHLAKIAPLLKEVLSEGQLKLEQISTIGVTTHPGLLGPLLTGINVAKTIAMRHEIPIVAVNHLFAHLEAVHLTEKISYPYIGLLVSGGHSIYFLVTDKTTFKVLGSTIDDAAGEAFDKGGKLLGLGYPAGRVIDDKAKNGKNDEFSFPIGLKHSKDCRLSFSGVKSSLRTLIEKGEVDIEKNMDRICYSYQKAIIDSLALKLEFALIQAKELHPSYANLPVVVGGGVACNSALRVTLAEKFNDVHFVRPVFCTDNGAMIANYALRHPELEVKYPDNLYLDARGKFINKLTQDQVRS
jgi:N6-L-threonylcarbamoyladenine synthase